MGVIPARPVGLAVAGARAYQARNGVFAPEADYSRAVVSPSAVHDVARAYNALPEFDRQAVPAYDAMRHEVGRQFEHLTAPVHKGGMGFDVQVTDHDPYDRAGDMLHDIAHRRIKVLSTQATGGHPLFSNDENDMFRAVHDVFGHAGTGRAVDRHGEEAAYRKHSTMFTPLARQALATETRGQNHAMIAAGGQFQEQKVAILPDHVRALGFVDPRTPQERVAAVTQARQFQREHGF